MTNKILYHLIHPYRCPICNEDLLFFTTKTNKIIDYKHILSNANTLSDTITFLGSRNIKHFKCIKCNKEFIIDWSKGWPEPLTDREALKKFGV